MLKLYYIIYHARFCSKDLLDSIFVGLKNWSGCPWRFSCPTPLYGVTAISPLQREYTPGCLLLPAVACCCLLLPAAACCCLLLPVAQSFSLVMTDDGGLMVSKMFSHHSSHTHALTEMIMAIHWLIWQTSWLPSPAMVGNGRPWQAMVGNGRTSSIVVVYWRVRDDKASKPTRNVKKS